MNEHKKYDIFISYSRKDSSEVSAFVTMLKERIPEINIWIDLKGVEAADEFDEKIISAINASSYVIFMMSNHSNSIVAGSSQWTKKELVYAKNTGKKIIPILLDNAQLNDWFLYEFGRVDCVNSKDDKQVEKLLKALARWTGKKLVKQRGTRVKKSVTLGEAENVRKRFDVFKRNVSVIFSAIFCLVLVILIAISIAYFKEQPKSFWKYHVVNDSIAPYTVQLIGKTETVKHLVIPATIQAGDTIYVVLGVEQRAFKGDSILESVVISQGVQSIGNGAFEDCKNLRSLVLPASVECIGDYILSGCIGLDTVLVDKDNPRYDSRTNCNAIIESTTNTLLAGCKSTSIPSEIKHIGDYAFSGIYFSDYLSLPDSVVSIGTRAFYNSSIVDFVSFNHNVTMIGREAFMECRSLKNIVYRGNVEQWDSIALGDRWNYLTSLKVVLCLDGNIKLSE